MPAQNNNRNFVGYEYLDVAVGRDMESFYIDGYENFGWQLDERPGGPAGVPIGLSAHSLKFKRDRKMINKAELTRLQRQFDACANEIKALEHSKASSATVAALIIGLIGCAFLALSVFAITAAPPNIILCIVFGLPGIIGWILPYFVYKRRLAKRSREVEPLINAKYDEIYEVCEKGSSLLPKRQQEE